MTRRPFEGNYGITLAIAVVAILLFILVTTAAQLTDPVIASDLDAPLGAFSILSGLGIAGYAFGALLGGDFIQRFAQRPLFFLCEAAFIAGCGITASAQSIAVYGAGFVLMGFATGLLLVIALPPAVQNFPAARMPVTAAVVNIGFFGAVTAGPLIGGAVAVHDAWRWLYTGLGIVAAAVFVLALLTLPDMKPKRPDAPVDWAAFILGALATFLPFWGTGELRSQGFGSILFAAPFAVGIACFVALMLVQFHQKEALSPVKPMWKPVPLTGILLAMAGGGVVVSLMELAEQFESAIAPGSPLAAGLLFWPCVLGTIVAALLLALLLRTRYLLILALAGMITLCGAAALMYVLPQDGDPLMMLAISGLIGFGAGATVSPGLWLAGFAMPSNLLGRLFALIELVRSEADFIMAPVLIQIAIVASTGAAMTAAGAHEAVLVTLVIALFSTLGIAALWFLSGAKMQSPDLERWLDKEQPEATALDPGGF